LIKNVLQPDLPMLYCHYNLIVHYPRIRINSDGKEREPMRKYLSMLFVLMLAAAFGLSACAKKEEPPPPPPPATAPMDKMMDNMAPAAPMDKMMDNMAPAEAPKK